MVTTSCLPRIPELVPPPLTDGIHVWAFRLDVTGWRERLRAEWLSADELVQSGRFARETLQRRFVVCRSTLRAILGRYLGRSPGELTFAQGPYGKPYLNAGRARGRLQFNVTHSDDFALVAVSRQRAVGVDLERVRPLDDIPGMVARHFARAEQQAFALVPPAVQLTTFYRYWTLKEAYLKACGVGLNGMPAKVDVSRVDDLPLRLPDAAGTARYWRGRGLELAPGYCGALVAEGRSDLSVTMLNQWLPTAALTRPETPPKVTATTPHHG